MNTLLPIEEAHERLLALAVEQTAIHLPIGDCVNHYLADDIVATRNQPARNLSAMDGYAVRKEDQCGPWTCIGESAAGRPFSGSIGPSQTVRIFTGAVVPNDTDCVIVQEDIAARSESVQLTGAGPNPHDKHIRKLATDFARDDIILSKGQHLTPQAIGLAIMAGHGTLPVRPMLKVAIISSGDELVLPGDPVEDHQIPNSNGLMIEALLASFPVKVENFGIVADDVDVLKNSYEAASEADVVVSIGGVSVGDYDFVLPALKKAGAEIDFWRIAMKPGKPLMAGKLDGSIVVGLPGNPASAFVTATMFLLPIVRKLLGSTEPLPKRMTANLVGTVDATGKRTEFIRAFVNDNQITPLTRQDSGMLTPLSAANALLIRSANSTAAPSGTKVEYITI